MIDGHIARLMKWVVHIIIVYYGAVIGLGWMAYYYTGVQDIIHVYNVITIIHDILRWVCQTKNNICIMILG